MAKYVTTVQGSIAQLRKYIKAQYSHHWRRAKKKKSENNETVFFPALPAELLSHGCDRLDSNQ